MTDKTIIVAVAHGSPADDAVALGVELARTTDAQLLLTGVYVIGLGSLPYPYSDLLRRETEDELSRLAAKVPVDVAVGTRTIGSTSVVRGLHECAEHTGPDVMVVGPTHLGKAQLAVRGDFTLGLLHSAPCAVAVAPAGYAGRACEGWKLIGVAWDASPEAESALETASDIARAVGARIRVIRVLEWPLVLFDVTVSDPEGVDEYVHATSAQVTAELEEACGRIAGVACESAVLDGVVDDELVQASADLDLLVMGSRGFGPVKRIVLGSVTTGVVHRAACPVLVLPRGVREPVVA